MKRTNRFITMALAACISISATAFSAFAADINTGAMQIVPAGSDMVVSELTYTPAVGDTIRYIDENGEQQEAVITEIDTAQEPMENGDIEPIWVGGWYTHTRINRNTDGNQGVQKGGTYTASSYDGHAAFKTKNWSGDLNALNYSLIDKTAGTAIWGRITTERPNGINIAAPTAGHQYYYVFSGESNTNDALYCDLFLYSDM